MSVDFSNICQSHLPISPWADAHLKRLPGINPMARGDWVLVDDAYDQQIAYADHLLATRCDDVMAIDDCAQDAARELLEHLLAALGMHNLYTTRTQTVHRPDGGVVKLDWDNPLHTARSLVQQDLCLMMPIGDEHVLVGGAMCFPASWTLSEKFMRPMTGIHDPVDEYGPDLAMRVERMFRMMRPTQDLWRANWLIYSDPELHQPRRGGEGRPRDVDGDQWMRVERQSLCKLPRTGAIVFGIHSYVVAMDRLDATQRASLDGVIAARG
jgi:hypothetical protein